MQSRGAEGRDHRRHDTNPCWYALVITNIVRYEASVVRSSVPGAVRGFPSEFAAGVVKTPVAVTTGSYCNIVEMVIVRLSSQQGLFVRVRVRLNCAKSRFVLCLTR